MEQTENSSPNFLLIWDSSESAENRALDSISILVFKEAALDRFFVDGFSFRRFNSVSSSHNASLPHRSTSSKAPLDRLMSSLVSTSAIIFGWGVHLIMDFVFTISSWMMESSIAVLLSCRDDWLCFVRESNKLFASVIEHCCMISLIWQSLFSMERKGLILLIQFSLQISPCRTSLIISWIHSSSPRACPKANVSLASVDATRRLSFEERHERTDTRILPDADGNLSDAIMTQAPCTLS